VIGADGLAPQPADFIAVLLLSALISGLFGAFKGAFALRLRSDHLAVITVALALLAKQAISNTNPVLGGIQGIAALPPPHLFTFPITRPLAQYYLVFALCVGVALLSQRLIRSRIGRAWLAGSEDETAAASCGIDVGRYKTLALIISCAVAGVAGALHAGLFAYTAPQTMDFRLSAMILAMVILGGAGNVSGAAMGAILIVGYSQILIPRLTEFLSQFQLNFINFGQTSDLREMSYFNFGMALYLTVLFRARRRRGTE
jgi:branched-chain amino acid transport system permease protein